LHEQILELVVTRPQITPRQVLQALAPRGEPASARRRQAIGDAIAQLVQQGRLARRTEVVRGRPAEILLTPEMAELAGPPVELPLEDIDDLDSDIGVEPVEPVMEIRPQGRSRFGERRSTRGAVSSPTFRTPIIEPDTLDIGPALDFAASEVETEVPSYQVTVEEMVSEPARATVEVPFEPEPEQDFTSPPAPAGRSAPVAPRATPATARRGAAPEPTRPTSRFRAPVFTHTPEVAEADAAPAPQQAETEAVAMTPTPAQAVGDEGQAQPQQQPEFQPEAQGQPEMTLDVSNVAPPPPVDEAVAEAAGSAEAATAEGAEGEAAAATARPRRRRSRRPSANGKSDAAPGEESGPEPETESEPATTPS